MANQEKKTKKVNVHELQANILTALQRGRNELTVYLMNSPAPIKGRIKQFDTYTITLSVNDGHYYVLYKHGIAGFSVEASIFKNMTFAEPEKVEEPVAA